MAWNIYNIGFHLAMYASYMGCRPKITPVSGEPIESGDDLPKTLRAHFWVPQETAGSMVIVDNVLPHLQEEANRLGLDWKVTQGSELPGDHVDWLICFKATPEPGRVIGNPRQVMLICDQAEVHWRDLPTFDEVVATSSETFSWLLAWRHSKVFFISESEPESHLEFGATNLAGQVADRGNVLLWHGGKHSLMSLHALRPLLESWAEKNDAELHVVCSRETTREEHWGRLKVCFFPWSEEQLRKSAAMARLAIVPAKRRLKLSWLKPASRVRCLYAQGVPAIGDRRTPDVQAFARPFDGPMAGGTGEWRAQLERLWNDSAELQRLATAGHAEVRNHGTTRVTARKWIRYLGQKR